MSEQVIKATSVCMLMSSFCNANYLLSCHGTIHMQQKFNANVLYNKRHKLFLRVQYIHMNGKYRDYGNFARKKEIGEVETP